MVTPHDIFSDIKLKHLKNGIKFFENNMKPVQKENENISHKKRHLH